jgi:hypothetical protein
MRKEDEKVVERTRVCVIRKEDYATPARKYEGEIVKHGEVADSRNKSTEECKM